MANESRSVTDPKGNEVFLLQDPGMELREDPESEIYDDAGVVVSRPALLIEEDSGGERLLHYFRSIGWNNTMLITAHFQNGRWEAGQYQRNPSSDQISALLRRGRQLI